MKYFFAVLFSLLTSMATADRTATYDEIGRIEVQKEVRTSQLKTIHLGEIAHFYNIPTNTMNDLKALVVGPAPKPNESLSYTSHDLSMKFRQAFALIQQQTGLRLMFKVPQTVKISHRPTEFSEENVRNEIIYKIQKTCLDCRFEISSLQLPLGAKKEKGNWSIEFGSNRIKGQFSLPIVFKNAEQKKILWVSGRLKKLKKVPVAARRLNTGDRIKNGDFKLEFRDVSFAADSAPKMDQLLGAKLRSGVAVDDVIWVGRLQKERALRFGDLTEVIVGGDNWQIKTNAVAQQNADVGDTVRLLNPQTRKYISGLVVDKKKVRIE